MKTWLNQRLAGVLQSTVADFRKELGPGLCCELDSVLSGRVVDEVVALVNEWQRASLLCFTFLGSQWRTLILSPSDLAQVLKEAVATEEVVAIVDPVGMGGCSVDFSPTDAFEVEALLVGWGDHEKMATELDARLGGKGTFRGN